MKLTVHPTNDPAKKMENEKLPSSKHGLFSGSMSICWRVYIYIYTQPGQWGSHIPTYRVTYQLNSIKFQEMTKPFDDHLVVSIFRHTLLDWRSASMWFPRVFQFLSHDIPLNPTIVSAEKCATRMVVRWFISYLQVFNYSIFSWWLTPQLSINSDG